MILEAAIGVCIHEWSKIQYVNKGVVKRSVKRSAEALAYLHVQISPISCNVVGSILLVLGKNSETAIVGYRRTVVAVNTTPSAVNWCKKFRVPD